MAMVLAMGSFYFQMVKVRLDRFYFFVENWKKFSKKNQKMNGVIEDVFFLRNKKQKTSNWR